MPVSLIHGVQPANEVGWNTHGDDPALPCRVLQASRGPLAPLAALCNSLITSRNIRRLIWLISSRTSHAVACLAVPAVQDEADIAKGAWMHRCRI